MIPADERMTPQERAWAYFFRRGLEDGLDVPQAGTLARNMEGTLCFQMLVLSYSVQELKKNLKTAVLKLTKPNKSP